MAMAVCSGYYKTGWLVSSPHWFLSKLSMHEIFSQASMLLFYRLFLVVLFESPESHANCNLQNLPADLLFLCIWIEVFSVVVYLTSWRQN